MVFDGAANYRALCRASHCASPANWLYRQHWLVYRNLDHTAEMRPVAGAIKARLLAAAHKQTSIQLRLLISIQCMCLLRLLINNSLPCSNPKPYTYMCIIQQQIHIYKYVQSHIVILHQHISVTPLTNIRMVYYKNTINTQIIVQKYMMLHLICKSNITSDL